MLRQPRRLAALACLLAAAPTARPDPMQAPAVVVRGQSERPAEREGRPADVLANEDLRRSVANTLGETLAHMPGTHNASFGPGVGLPVIRGLSGARVRVAVDGSGTHDASSLSPDHAVTVEPMLAEEIRVLRGPETIRYGSGAIGGAVEVSDGRIRTRRLSRAVEGAVESRYGTNGHERAQAAKIRTGSGRLILHGDAFHRERGDLGIPGLAVDEAAVAQQFGITSVPNTREFTPNTSLRTHGGGAGVSWVGDDLHLGVALGSMENNYGVPPGGHTHGTAPLLDPTIIEGQNVRIDMQQTRLDLKGEVFVRKPLVRSVRVRAARVNYRHDEVDSGRPVTTFANHVGEYRLEADHAPSPFLTGTLGFHRVSRDVSGRGQEAFLPRARAGTTAIYVIEKYDTGLWLLEGALRTERQEIAPDPIDRSGGTFAFPATSYRPLSLSGALTLRFTPKTRLTGTLSRPERAPDVQELYSLGPHLATRTYSIGNRNLRTESMQRLDLGLVHDWDGGAVHLNTFRYDARDFIYQRNLGLFYDLDARSINALCVSLDRCLPVYQYRQQDAIFNGYEARLTLRFPSTPLGAFESTFFTDAVRARFTAAGGGDVPRLPPRRVGVDVAHFSDAGWMTRLRWTRAAAQDNPGTGETPSPGYDLVDLHVERTISEGSREWIVFGNAKNLLDEDIRNATSFLRSFSPEAGRRLEVGVRLTF